MVPGVLERVEDLKLTPSGFPADFAGGGPVHMTSGTASLIWSLYLGKRRGYGTAKLAYRPHSVSHVILGTTLIWFGW